MPTLYIIAGPNGVGKTTFADRYLPEEAKRIRELIAHKTSFTWETTMSGKTAASWLRAARSEGYVLKTYFLWVRDVTVTIDRVRQRVTEGGHNIDEDVSRNRFFKTIQNFFSMYRPIMDSWKLLENDLTSPRLLAVEKRGRLVVRDPVQLDRISREAEIEI